MIILEDSRRQWSTDPRGQECGVVGFRGRFRLFVGGDDDPAIEGTDALELERWAKSRGAELVRHFYCGGADHGVCHCGAR